LPLQIFHTPHFPYIALPGQIQPHPCVIYYEIINYFLVKKTIVLNATNCILYIFFCFRVVKLFNLCCLSHIALKLTERFSIRTRNLLKNSYTRLEKARKTVHEECVNISEIGRSLPFNTNQSIYQMQFPS